MTSPQNSADADPQLPTPSWPLADAAVRDVFETMFQDGSWGRYHGPHCDALRSALAEFHGVEHVILCSSGTVAVELALRAAKVQPGDEVVLAAYDYKANFANVVNLAAIPVLVDTLPGLPVLDPEQLQNAISDRTRAIVCSHLHGSFARIHQIRAIAEEHGLSVIEDACQAPGAVLEGRRVGSIGTMGVLSFGGSKLLTSGRGGAVLTSDAMLAQRIRLYTQRGNDAYPLSEMQAAVLLPQLRQLADRNETRCGNVCRIQEQLPPAAALRLALNPGPQITLQCLPAYFKVAFRYSSAEGGPAREELSQRLRNAGIAMDPAFPALHRIHGRSRFRSVGDLPHASLLHDQLMTLHHPVLLQDEAQIDTLVAELSRW